MPSILLGTDSRPSLLGCFFCALTGGYNHTRSLVVIAVIHFVVTVVVLLGYSADVYLYCQLVVEALLVPQKLGCSRFLVVVSVDI